MQKPRRALLLLEECAHSWPLLKRAAEIIKKTVVLQSVDLKMASDIPSFLLDKR